MERQAGVRLLVALALSVTLHLSLLYGVGIGSSQPSAFREIEARLVAAPQDATPRQFVARARSVPSAAEVARPGLVQAMSDSARPVAARLPEDESLKPKVDVAVIVDPTWYEARDLDVYPRLVAPVEPEYPVSAANPGVSGELTLVLLIDEAGIVQDMQVVDAQPPGYFEDAALTAFRSARFSPAQREGHAVRSRIAIRVRMRPPETRGLAQQALH
ncbi:MAG TPA: energy transducer TonB [Burkholderiales bacterium]|nr:energy transducer TonB [Burkholderiales bacterium]